MTTHITDFDTESQKLIKKWFTIRTIAKSTREVYLSYITQFLQYNNTTLHEIYTTTKNEEKTATPQEEMTITQYFLEYKYYLDESQYAETTKNLKLNVICSFCNAFKIPLPQIRRKRAICEEKNYGRPLKKSELQLMITSNPLREKAFLSIQALSGMGSKEVRTLTIKHLINTINTELKTDYKDITDIIHNRTEILKKDVFLIKIIRKKVNYRYITFIPRETMTHIFNYLEYRYKQTDKKKIKNSNDYIFITKDGNPMTSKAVTAMYRIIGENVGFQSEDDTYRYWRSHNIRKYFYNICEEQVGIEYADEWLGHIPSKVTRAYARRENRMRTAYMKCLPFLTLENTRNIELEQKIVKLEKELKKLKKTL